MLKVTLFIILLTIHIIPQADIRAIVERDSTPVHYHPSIGALEFGYLSKGEPVIIQTHIDVFFRINYNGDPGYIFEKNVVDYTTIIKTIETTEKRLQDSIKAEVDKAKAELLNIFTKKFGAKVGKRLLNEEIWLGMTIQMVYYGWGEPDDSSRLVSSTGIYETLIYSERGTTLYFINEKLDRWLEY